jgi:HK97 family phage major capsid protein
MLWRSLNPSERKTEKGAEMPAEVKIPSQEDQSAVIMNEKSVEGMADITKQMAGEEVRKLFGEDLGEALLKARLFINSKAELAKASEIKNQEKGGALSPEQQAEWFKCQLQGCAPDEDLDEGGIISQHLGKRKQDQALTPSGATTGGYLVPTDMRLEIIKKADEPAVIWPLVNKQNTRSEAVTKPCITTYIDVNEGTAAKSSSATSSDDVTENEPVYGQKTWTMRYFDNLFYAKVDLLEDSPIDVMADLMWQTGDKFAYKHEYNVLQGAGSGSSLPQGLMDSGSGITAVNFGGAPTLARVLDFYRQLGQRYRTGAVAIMDGEIMYAIVEELATEVRSAQFLIDKLPTMLESAYMTANKILVGQMRYYEVYVNRLMYVMSVLAPKKFSHEVTVVEKWDGQPVLLDAFLIGTGVTPGS